MITGNFLWRCEGVELLCAGKLLPGCFTFCIYIVFVFLFWNVILSWISCIGKRFKIFGYSIRLSNGPKCFFNILHFWWFEKFDKLCVESKCLVTYRFCFHFHECHHLWLINKSSCRWTFFFLNEVYITNTIKF